jgi:LPS-assembly lipoprotein
LKPDRLLTVQNGKGTSLSGMFFWGIGLMAAEQIAMMSTLKKIASLTAIVTLAAALSACRPMYGQTSMGSDTASELAAVEVAIIPGRVGQQIRNELIFLFTGGDHAAVPNYKLDVVFRQSVLSVLFKRTDDAAGQIYSIDATFTLREINGKTVLMNGRSHARAAFDKHKSTYSNIRAERDAKNRAAKDIAKDISTRIAAYISSNR